MRISDWSSDVCSSDLFDVRIVLGDADHDFTPQTRSLHHVFLVDRTDALVALARGLERDTRNALHFRRAVVHGVVALGSTIGGRATTARLTEIDVAGQLAQDQDVEPLDHLTLQR